MFLKMYKKFQMDPTILLIFTRLKNYKQYILIFCIDNDESLNIALFYYSFFGYRERVINFQEPCLLDSKVCVLGQKFYINY